MSHESVGETVLFKYSKQIREHSLACRVYQRSSNNHVPYLNKRKASGSWSNLTQQEVFDCLGYQEIDITSKVAANIAQTEKPTIEKNLSQRKRIVKAKKKVGRRKAQNWVEKEEERGVALDDEAATVLNRSQNQQDQMDLRNRLYRHYCPHVLGHCQYNIKQKNRTTLIHLSY